LQLYYDQFLPPALAEAHLDTVQGLFGLTLTPQEAADIMERTAVEQLGAVTE
jgi:raffinose/stachyose/melibiose transport system substrate-binding protein